MGTGLQTEVDNTINIINENIQTMLNDTLVPKFMKDEWKLPTILPLKVNNCTETANKMKDKNTNRNCLLALVQTCNSSIMNQNNTIGVSNCDTLLNYTKDIVNRTYNKTLTDYNNSINDWNGSWEFVWNCYGGCTIFKDCAEGKGHRGPDNTICTRYDSGASGCSPGFYAIKKQNHNSCQSMKDNYQWKTILPKYQKIFNDITCPTLTLVPTPAINCCNNVLNCEYAECINIIQTCKQTISGETEISNATQCQRSECPMNGQLCLAGTPGAGPFNWICQNNKWVKKQPAPPPTAPTPPTAPMPPIAPTPSTAPALKPPVAFVSSIPVKKKPITQQSSSTNYTLYLILFIVLIFIFAFCYFAML